MSRSRSLARTGAALLLLSACSTSPSGEPVASAGAGGASSNPAGAGGTLSAAGAVDSLAGGGALSAGAGAGGAANQAGEASVAGSPSGGGASSSGAGGASGAPSQSKRVLIYTKSTGFVHASTPTAAQAIASAATAAGLLPEQSEDPSLFAPAELAVFGAVVLLATTGEPFGSPGTTQIQTLIDYVHGGGALVGIENCNHAYDDSVPYISLIGADFNGHPAFGPDTCYTDGAHPSVMKLPASFAVTDEIYLFTKFNPANQVVLRCGSDKRPISWVRQEGDGRVFYTALGHDVMSWTKPPLVDSHVLPGLLWAMGR